MRKRIAILQHESAQGPGVLLDCLRRQDFETEVFPPGEGRPGSLDGFAGMVVLGSNASANSHDGWVAEELALVRRALEADVPVLGHCFGAQLLARAMGARVLRNPWPQIGWQRLAITPPARALFGGREQVEVFNWHYDGFDIPRGAARTMFGRYSLNKGFRHGRHLGFQSHLEVTAEGIRAWCDEAGDELARARGPAVQSRDHMLAGLPARTAALRQIAATVYANWVATFPRPLLVAAQA